MDVQSDRPLEFINQAGLAARPEAAALALPVFSSAAPSDPLISEPSSRAFSIALSSSEAAALASAAAPLALTGAAQASIASLSSPTSPSSTAAAQAKKGSLLQLLLLCSSIYAIYFLAIYLFSPAAHADNGDAEFYHQLLKIPQATGYQPTRNFTIVIDTENGNQLVADDDASLRFNQLWIQQFQPGHQDRHGGAAFGEVFRSFFKQVYRNYRESHAQALSAYPDENGSIKRSSYSSSMDYNIKVSDDEVRFKIQYSY